jgi:light-regulated signal transduction histidine kinase (bacteriophytochrome)
MNRLTITTVALALAAALAAGPALARGPWGANSGNTWGWQLMTPQERVEHQNKMRSFTTYDLTNLVDNALNYGQRAEITVTDAPARLTLVVRDRGPGIPAAELERVFEPFYRLESSRSRDTGGTGLGLSIARNIARAHGGELTLRNHPQGGLEAVLELPR